MVQVLIVEDDPMARTLFELYLKHSGRYELAAAIESASMAELYCLKNPVNLIIMDVCTALKASGLTAAAKIKKNSPGIRIVLVTSQPECDFIHRAKEAGIDSFWYKESAFCTGSNDGGRIGISGGYAGSEGWRGVEHRVYGRRTEGTA